MAEPQRSGEEPQQLPPEAHSSSSFRVLGIAMVVDQRGRPARTVLRYPTSTKHAAAAGGTTSGAAASSTEGSEADQEHLFYKLSGRQMAKLFRPKPSLTGQPMTLSVGGTVFCCCAVLLGEDTYHGGVGDSSNTNTNDADASSGYQSSDDNADELVLFSVIVALAPQARTSSSILPIGGWMTEGSSSGDGTRKPKQQSTSEEQQLQSLLMPLDILQGRLGQPTGRASESFLSVRRVHVSLGRLCRVLEREERRCRYVSVQANLFDQIRADLTSSFGSSGSKSGNSHNAKSNYSYWQNFQETATASLDEPEDAAGPTNNTATSIKQPQHSPKGSVSASLVTPTAANTTSSNSNNSALNKDSTSPPLPPPAPIGSPPPTANNTPGASPASLISSKTGTGATATTTAPTTIGSAPPTTRHHRRANSNFSVTFEREITVAASNKTAGGANSEKTSKKKQLQEEKERLLELEQIILETCMAAPPTHTTINYFSNSYNNNNDYYSSNSGVVIEHLGNLARELVQVYHALGRNEYQFAPTPATLLSGGEGVVYVNRHIAIAIEPVAFSSSSLGVVDTYYNDGDRAVLVRPYQTLLFPNASPSELLESMTTTTLSSSYGAASTTTAMAPRRLQQLLRMVHPQKSLTDIAVDTNLPLGTTLDLAAYLVGQGACIASSVLSRKIRLATSSGTERIRRAALPFAQQFGAAVRLFELVAFLTEPGRTLGDCMKQLIMATSDSNNMNDDTNNDDNADDRISRLRQDFLSCLSAKRMMGKTGSSQDLTGGGHAMMDAAAFVVEPITGAGGGVVSPDDPHLAVLLPHADDIEDLLYQMVVWLCSHKVLVQLQDYLIAKFPIGGGGGGSYNGAGTPIDPARTIDEDESMHQQLNSNSNSNPIIRYYQHEHPTEHKSDTNVRLDSLSDDLLFQELLDSDCLSGKISVPACCWKTGLDPIKLYQLVARSPRQLSIVTRLPARGDDWEDEW